MEPSTNKEKINIKIHIKDLNVIIDEEFTTTLETVSRLINLIVTSHPSYCIDISYHSRSSACDDRFEFTYSWPSFYLKTPVRALDEPLREMEQMKLFLQKLQGEM